MRVLLFVGLLLVAGCAQPGEVEGGVRDDEGRVSREPLSDKVVRFTMGSPLTGACVSAACGMAPTEASALNFVGNGTILTGFSFNVTLVPVQDVGLQPRFFARCVEISFEVTPCPGVPDPLSTVAGPLPQVWEASGFQVGEEQVLRFEVRRDGQPSLTPLAAGEGTGDNYRLEGVIHQTNATASA